MNKIAIISLSLILALVAGLAGCVSERLVIQTRTIAETQTITQTETITEAPTELEAQINQLKAENQRLLSENQQLSSDLAEITSQLQTIQSLVSSSSYSQILSILPWIQADANGFATFLQGLPDLPPLLPGLTVSQIDDAINDAINIARDLRSLLERLPAPPPLIAPPVWYELDEMKDEFIRMTEWVENLENLPDFLKVAGDFDDLRSGMIDYLRDVATTASNTKSILEEVRNTVSSE